jgi:hypothetical protein
MPTSPHPWGLRHRSGPHAQQGWRPAPDRGEVDTDAAPFLPARAAPLTTGGSTRTTGATPAATGGW